MRSSGFAAVLVAAVVAAATGCAGSVRDGDALDLGQTPTRLCVPSPVEGNTLVGDTVLRLRDQQSVTITELTLVDAQDLVLVEATLVALMPGDDLVGIRHTADPGPLPALWDSRVPVERAVVEPGRDWNLVLEVESHAEDIASAEAARISYEDSAGSQYQQDTLTTILIGRRPCPEVLEEAEAEASNSHPSDQ